MKFHSTVKEFILASFAMCKEKVGHALTINKGISEASNRKKIKINLFVV